MLAMSQLRHYVNRRNVQAAVFPGLALFFSAGKSRSAIKRLIPPAEHGTPKAALVQPDIDADLSSAHQRDYSSIPCLLFPADGILAKDAIQHARRSTRNMTAGELGSFVEQHHKARPNLQGAIEQAYHDALSLGSKPFSSPVHWGAATVTSTCRH